MTVDDGGPEPPFGAADLGPARSSGAFHYPPVVPVATVQTRAPGMAPATDASVLVAPAAAAGLDGAAKATRRRRWPRALVALLLVVLVLGCAGLSVAVVELRRQVRSQRVDASVAKRLTDERLAAGVAATNGLAERLGVLEAKVGDQPDLPKVAGAVQPSVFTIRTAGGLGSGFVLRSVGGRSTVVTNFHVVADAWRTASRQVSVDNENRRLTGVIQRVVEADDLALIEVEADLPALERATTPPKVGDPVLAIGSPLGLSGSASSGIVSAVRADALQFSAPVSPGNSGGPVIDRRGHVLGITTSKLVGNGAEGLSFAIPVDTVCTSLKVC